MYGATYPETWTFALDQRSTHMSLTTTTETEGPVLATPDAVDAVVAGFAHTEATPPEVRSLLDVSCMLLRMCVVHYEFAAIAVEKSLQALERALRIHLAAGDKIPFAALVKRLPARGEISEADVELIDAGRELRNRLFAHPAGDCAAARDGDGSGRFVPSANRSPLPGRLDAGRAAAHQR